MINKQNNCTAHRSDFSKHLPAEESFSSSFLLSVEMKREVGEQESADLPTFTEATPGFRSRHTHSSSRVKHSQDAPPGCSRQTQHFISEWMGAVTQGRQANQEERQESRRGQASPAAMLCPSRTPQLNVEVPAAHPSSLGSSDPSLVLLRGGSAHDCGVHRVTGEERKRRERVTLQRQQHSFMKLAE